MSVDDNRQPVSEPRSPSRNKDKAICGLRGILLGITADEKLGEQELLFLDVWLRSQQSLRADGDAIYLLDLIGEALRDKQISAGQLTQLNELINDVIDFKHSPSEREESQLNELLGLLSGVASDGALTDSEIEEIRSWLRENSNIIDLWPTNVICQRINSVLEDGIVSDDEREHLLKTIEQITGSRFEETGAATGMATEFLENAIDTVRHDGSKFCFTGVFVSGPRKGVEAAAESKGARVLKSVTQDLDYLVIGTVASRDWRFLSHGCEIEKALNLQASGCKIVIISERTWLKYV